MVTEIHAFYCGILMANAFAMIVLWRCAILFVALVVGGLPLAASSKVKGIIFAFEFFKLECW